MSAAARRTHQPTETTWAAEDTPQVEPRPSAIRDATGKSFNDARRFWLASFHADRHGDIRAPTAAIVFVIGEWFNGQTFDEEGILCAWPSQALIAQQARIEERAVRNHLKVLKERGHLRVKRGGDGRSSTYIATIPERHGDAGLNVCEENSDRHHSANRPARGGKQTGTVVPTTSDTSDTSEPSGGRPKAAPPSGTPRSTINGSDKSRDDIGEAGEHGGARPQGAPPSTSRQRYQEGQVVEVVGCGRCEVLEVEASGLVWVVSLERHDRFSAEIDESGRLQLHDDLSWLNEPWDDDAYAAPF